MSRKGLVWSFVTSVTLILSIALGAGAVAPKVEDPAGLFSPAARDEANRIIERIYRETGPPHKDVLVQTLPRLPAGKEIRDVANAEFQSQRGNGVLILVVRDPGKLWVTVGEDTRKGFGTAEVEELVTRVMVPRLRERKNDQALLDGLRFVERKFEVFRASGAAPGLPAPAPAAPVTVAPAVARQTSAGINWLWVIVVLLAVWVVVGLLRAVFRRVSGAGASAGHASGAPGYAPAPTGGGWLSAIFGGLAGAVAGNWIYHHFFGGGQSSSWGTGTADAAERSDAFASSGDEGRVGGGGGGDWDDPGSGPDVGSGGDVGGDYGGGGDFGSSD